MIPGFKSVYFESDPKIGTSAGFPLVDNTCNVTLNPEPEDNNQYGTRTERLMSRHMTYTICFEDNQVFVKTILFLFSTVEGNVIFLSYSDTDSCS